MADKTKIEWTDATWNPMTGCTRVSPGCEHCYIDWAPPFRIEGRHFVDRDGQRSNAIGSTTGVRLHLERLDQPLRWKKPRRVFVNSLSDIFHEDVPDEYIARIFAVMALAPQHTFQVLTKRHGRMRSLLNSESFKDKVLIALLFMTAERGIEWPPPQGYAWPIPNVWLGVTVEDQQRADLRIPALLDTPAAVRFLSCEPLLGRVGLSRWLDPERDCDCGVPALEGAGQHAATCRSFDQPEINWVIVGGESGKDARPMHPEWARSLRDQCTAAGVPFFFKQWGEWAPPGQAASYSAPATRGGTAQTPSGGHRSAYIDDAGSERSTNELTSFRIPETWAQVARVGKRDAGRELDGRTWDETP